MTITNGTVLLHEAAALLSEHGENPEYDRAIAELTAVILGGSLDYTGRVAAQLRTIHPTLKGPTMKRPTPQQLPPPTNEFGGVTARIAYEYINSGTGQWTEATSPIHGNGENYAANVREAYTATAREFAGRADRRNMRIEVRPDRPDWIEVPFSPDTNLADIEGALFACEHATWTPARVPEYHSLMTTGDFVQAVVDGGGTNIE